MSSDDDHFFQVHHKDAFLRHSQTIHTPPVVHDNDLPFPSNASSGHQQVLSWAVPNSFLGNKVGNHFHIIMPSTGHKEEPVHLSACMPLSV